MFKHKITCCLFRPANRCTLEFAVKKCSWQFKKNYIFWFIWSEKEVRKKKNLEKRSFSNAGQQLNAGLIPQNTGLHAKKFLKINLQKPLIYFYQFSRVLDQHLAFSFFFFLPMLPFLGHFPLFASKWRKKRKT